MSCLNVRKCNDPEKRESKRIMLREEVDVLVVCFAFEA